MPPVKSNVGFVSSLNYPLLLGPFHLLTTHTPLLLDSRRTRLTIKGVQTLNQVSAPPATTKPAFSQYLLALTMHATLPITSTMLLTAPSVA